MTDNRQGNRADQSVGSAENAYQFGAVDQLIINNYYSEDGRRTQPLPDSVKPIVFISYAGADGRPYAAGIETTLREEYNFRTWWDYKLLPGENWWRAIQAAVDDADAVIIVMTQGMLTSKWVMEEYRHARKRRKRIICVQVEPGFGPRQAVAEFYEEQWADLSGRNYQSGMRKLVQALPNMHLKMTQQRRRTPWRWLTIGAVIVLLAVAALLLLLSTSGNPPSEGTPTTAAVVAAVDDTAAPTSTIPPTGPPTDEPTHTARPTDPPTDQPTNTIPPTELPTDTPTTAPTDTPQPPSLTPTPELSALEQALALARQGVDRNADWTAYSEYFGDVEMVLVPAGCFMMGSEDGDSDERPVHEVCFEEPYWIDRYEVTNEQYGSFGRFSRGDRPRERIDWFEAQAFCEERGARLPTEAEWEYAARGPDGLVYPWGNEFVADNVVYSGNAGGETAPVGSRPGGVSWVGAYDLSGNVWEWTADWYGEYLSERQVNPAGPESGTARGLRGGSWDISNSWYFRAADRSDLTPDNTSSNVGFRCARLP